MLKVPALVEQVLDAIQLLVEWAAAWIVGLVVVSSPFLILGLQLDAAGYRTASLAFVIAMSAVYCIGLLLAFVDLALRVKRNESIFEVLRRAWSKAVTSRTATTLSPVARLIRQFVYSSKEVLSSILSLGLRTVGLLLLAIIGGVVIYSVFGLLSTVPWWAIVIIVLLVAK